MVTSGAENVVKFWLVDLDELRSAVCKSLWRDLTEHERQIYGVTSTNPTCP